MFGNTKVYVLIGIVVILVAGLITIFALMGGDSDEDVVQPMPVPSPQVVVTPPPEEDVVYVQEEPDDSPYDAANMLNGVPIVGVREVVDGMFQSYLTGEWKPVEVSTRRPFAIMIANNKPALPQYGISQYSIIFEAPVESRITRLLVYIEDYDDLDRVGPVRSARHYFLWDAIGKDAIFCNWGLAVPYVADLINSDIIDNVSQALSGIAVGAPEAYERVSRPGVTNLEYTGYMSINGYNRAVNRLGYETHYNAEYVPQFTFAAEGTRVEYEGYGNAIEIWPGGKGGGRGGYSGFNPYFVYNEDDQLYYRFQSGAKQIDEMNGEQLTCSNIVFQFTQGRPLDSNDYLDFTSHQLDGNKAVVFTNGKFIDGTWVRPYENDLGNQVPAKFYDLQGNEIILNQGRTWICLIWDEYGSDIDIVHE